MKKPRRGGVEKPRALALGSGVGIGPSPEGAAEISLGREPQDSPTNHHLALKGRQIAASVVSVSPITSGSFSHGRGVDLGAVDVKGKQRSARLVPA